MFKTFEEAIYQRCIKCTEITDNLTSWNSIPAIFNNNFPPDSDAGWEHKKQYPRIVFYVDWSNAPERLINGKLVVFIQWHNDQQIKAEIIEYLVKQNLSNVFYNTERGVFCCSWNVSEPFTYEGTEQVVNGLRMEFDVIAFPDQRTYLMPDPVPGIEDYLKKINEELIIINRDELPDIFVPENPVAYVRTISLQNKGEDTYAYRFMEIQAVIHIISTNNTLTRKAIGKIQQQAMIDGDIDLENGNQMLITDAGNNLTIGYINDSLLDGQYTLTGRFALNALEPIEGTVKQFLFNERFENVN